MDKESQPDTSLSKEDLADFANAQLQSVLKNLKETRKILARDWEQLTPRERSAHSREVKDLERQKKTFLEEIEIKNPRRSRRGILRECNFFCQVE